MIDYFLEALKNLDITDYEQSLCPKYPETTVEIKGKIMKVAIHPPAEKRKFRVMVNGELAYTTAFSGQQAAEQIKRRYLKKFGVAKVTDVAFLDGEIWTRTYFDQRY